MRPNYADFMAKSKKITIITANYYPEDTAIGLYTAQFSEYLASKGFAVTVITGFPYYPQWKIAADYQSKPTYFSEIINGIEVIRYRQFVPEKVSFIGRIKMMLSFLHGTIRNIKKINDTDLVLCIVPFTISVFPAYLLSKKAKAKLWIHIQDFEFDLAFQSGILKKGNALVAACKKLVLFVETKLLKKADVISSISYSMLKKVGEKSQITHPYFFPNWVSADKINPDLTKPHRYIDKNKFTLLYSGNIGEKQDWKTFENLCHLITDNSIEILIVGDGGYLNTLKEKTAHFKFVKFLPPVPYDELPDLLCSADLHFLFQKQDVVDSIMPSKLLGMMASGKPSIITGNPISEVAEIIRQSKGGFYFSDKGADEIYSAVQNLKESGELCHTMGQNARKYITEAFSETVILGNLEQKINSILS